MPDLLIYKYLDELVKRQASDMYLTVGYPAGIRDKNNNIIPLNKSPLQQTDIQRFINEILDDKQKQEFTNNLELNLSITRKDKSRFRFNFFRQQQKSGIIIRRINTQIPTIDELELPEIYKNIILKKSGLIILSSPGGSGKTTSMAAMLGHRNLNGTGHILTIEDPIEFVHEHKKCIFTQREVGTDTSSYSQALKNALRQRADVIAIGEIRDKDAMEHALIFAETGHLCIATLHSNNTSQAIDRIVNFFPEDARSSVLTTLSQNLLAIFSQGLVPNLSNNNCVAVEILLNEGLIRNLISENRIPEIYETVERGHDAGMQTFDQALIDLFYQEKISYDTAIAHATSPSALKLKMGQNNMTPTEMIRAEEEKKNQF